MTVIRVGGSTEDEVKEKKTRCTRPARRSRGVVAGGGAALLASKSLDKLTPSNNDQKVGIDIVRRARQAPVRQIAENSGTDGSIIVGKLMENKNTTYGYDAQKGEFTDMIKAGIIDPTKVVRARASGRRVHRRHAHHHRGDGRREARAQERADDAAGRRHGLLDFSQLHNNARPRHPVYHPGSSCLSRRRAILSRPR